MVKFYWALGAVLVVILLVYLRGKEDGKRGERLAGLDERLKNLKEVADAELDSEMARSIVDRVAAYRERVLGRAQANGK